MTKWSPIGLAVCLLGGLFGSTTVRRSAPAMSHAKGSPAAVPYVWRSVVIGGGGFVPGIIFSAKQPDLIYARTDIGGAYRWDAASRQWKPLTDWVSQADANLLGIESLAADPVDANRVYLAAGTYTQSWTGNGAILRSRDQGRTWQRTDMPFKMGGNENGRSIGERLAVDPNQNSILFFGSRDDGLWKSADYAATWHKVERFPVTGRTNGIGIGFVVFDPRSGSPRHPTQTIYVGIAASAPYTGSDDNAAPPTPNLRNTLYRSRNGGATWEPVPGQPAGLLPHHGVLASDGTLYLTYGNGPGPNGMTDGAVWKFDTNTGVRTDITPLKSGSQGTGRFGYAGLSVDARHPTTLMVATLDRWNPGDDLFRSTDAGAHWTALGPKAERDVSATPFLTFGGASAKLGWWMGTLQIDPFHSGRVLYGTGATIFGSVDVTHADSDQTTHWKPWTQGMEETAVLDLVSPPTGAHLLSALGDIGAFRHDDLNVSPRAGMWTNPVMSNTDSLDFAESRSEIVARVGRGTPGKSGAYSTDGAVTWTPFPTEPAGSRGGGSIAVSADGRNFLWLPFRSVPSLSTDRGATWTACQGLPANARPISDRVDPNVFYAFDPSGTLYTSTDDGAHFTALATGLTSERARLKATPGYKGDLWLAAGKNGLFHRADLASGFVKMPGVQEAYAMGFGKAAQAQRYPALYMTGTVEGVAGVFRSDDAGASWVRINDDRHQYGWIGQVVTGDPRIYGRVYLGTNGRGILYADPAR